MTNKEYKAAAEAATYYSFWDALTVDDARQLRQEYRNDAKQQNAAPLPGANGRAVVIPTERGAILKSYHTEVAAIIDGVMYRLWSGWRATTSKHVATFCRLYGLPALSKRAWLELPAVAEIVDNETGEILYPAF